MRTIDMKKTVDFNKALKDIEVYAKNFLKEEFDMDLKIPVEMNGRLKNVFGRFMHYNYPNRNGSIKIEFSKDFVAYHPIEEIISTIKHECVHYALYELGKPYKDGDKYFEDYLKKVGADSTGTKSSKSPSHHYACGACGYSFTRKVRKNYSGYGCGKCGTWSKITYKGFGM